MLSRSSVSGQCFKAVNADRGRSKCLSHSLGLGHGFGLYRSALNAEQEVPGVWVQGGLGGDKDSHQLRTARIKHLTNEPGLSGSSTCISGSRCSRRVPVVWFDDVVWSRPHINIRRTKLRCIKFSNGTWPGRGQPGAVSRDEPVTAGRPGVVGRLPRAELGTGPGASLEQAYILRELPLSTANRQYSAPRRTGIALR